MVSRLSGSVGDRSKGGTQFSRGATQEVRGRSDRQDRPIRACDRADGRTRRAKPRRDSEIPRGRGIYGAEDQTTGEKDG